MLKLDEATGMPVHVRPVSGVHHEHPPHRRQVEQAFMRIKAQFGSRVAPELDIIWRALSAAEQPK